jgi:hypothetical protein
VDDGVECPILVADGAGVSGPGAEPRGPLTALGR